MLAEFQNIADYGLIHKLKYDIFDYHLHYKDMKKANTKLSPDIVLHTTFQAQKKDNGAFYWENKLSEG